MQTSRTPSSPAGSIPVRPSGADVDDPFDMALRALDRAGVIYEILSDSEHLVHAA